MSDGILHHLAISLPKTLHFGERKTIQSGICKDQVDEAFLTVNGFRGDGVADLKHHGGLDRAVCIYPYEHYEQWNIEFECTLPDTTFGENATVKQLDETLVCIGDIWQFGDAIIQVTQGRIPCSTITKRTGIPKLLKRIVETGHTGYLCRVLQEGTVYKKSPITVLERNFHKVTIQEAHEVYFHRSKDRHGIERILAVEQLAAEWRKQLEKRLEK